VCMGTGGTMVLWILCKWEKRITAARVGGHEVAYVGFVIGSSL
jgi:hypothetical protein